MSEKMIAVAKAFAKGKKSTFPIMTAKELEKFLEVMRTERLKQTH
ncbi:TPA: hypothetical protein ACHWC7_004043 [Providencia stuartii]|nr:hypothetical protein [Proteus mirabilis]